MILYLLRHGHAVNVGENNVRCDFDRMLTGEGKEKVRQVVKAVKRTGKNPEKIFTSPLVRAMETAEIAADELDCKEVEKNDELAPCGDHRELIRFLRNSEIKSAMLVGHMPDLSELACRLISRKNDAQIHFKKAGLCCVSFDGELSEGEGLLEFLIQPANIIS